MELGVIRKYAAGAMLVGGIIAFAGSELNSMDAMAAGGSLLVVGGAALFLTFQRWYCANCGQALSRGKKPQRCNRCGSNRVTTDDPGVGEAVRVKQR